MPRQAQLVKPQIKSTVKTKEVEAVKQVIKQDESLEIIQTLLGASVRTNHIHYLSLKAIINYICSLDVFHSYGQITCVSFPTSITGKMTDIDL